MRRWSVLVLVPVLLAACGGTKGNQGASSPAPGGSPAITKAEFLQQGNAICAQMNRQMAGVPTTGSDAGQILDGLHQELSILSSGIQQLKALPEPPADTATIQAIFAKVDATANLLTLELTAEAAGNMSQADALDAQVSSAGKAANAGFSAYGLTVCGSS